MLQADSHKRPRMVICELWTILYVFYDSLSKVNGFTQVKSRRVKNEAESGELALDIVCRQRHEKKQM